jgi:Tol biopolymer transport system component
VSTDNGGAAQVDGSRTGTVVTRREAVFNLAWLDHAAATPLFREPGNYHGPAVSHDGNRVAYSAGENVWVYDLRRDMRTRLTGRHTAAGSKAWSSDDKFVIFSTPEGIWYVQSDGGSEARLLLPSHAPSWRVATSITGDRRSSRLAFHEFTVGGGGTWDQWTVPVHIEGTQMRAGNPEPFRQTKHDERHLDFAPDGRWGAYISREEGGRHETLVRAFPDDGRRWKISDGVGYEPRWSPRRPELFFQADELLMVAPYSVEGRSFVPGKPRVWSRQPLPLLMQRGGPVYSVSPDGRVVAIVADQPSAEYFERRVTLWINAVADLRRQAAASR